MLKKFIAIYYRNPMLGTMEPEVGDKVRLKDHNGAPVRGVVAAVHGDGLLSLHPICELFTFKNARDRVARRQANKALRSKRRHPTAVEINDCDFRVENFEDLLLIGFGVRENFLFRQLFSRCWTTGWITDEPRKIADEKDHRVAQILKMLHLPNKHCMAKVDIWSRRIKSRLHPKRLPCLF